MSTAGPTDAVPAGEVTGVVREQLFTPVAGGHCLTVIDHPEPGPVHATIVLAHGLTGDRVGPVELLAQLSAQLCRTARARVVRFDLRGSGDSPGEFDRTSFAGMIEDFEVVASRHAEPGRPLVCAGISIGGVPAAVAAHQLWQQGRLEVAGVVLMSSDLIEGVRFGAAPVTPIRGGEFHLPQAFFREREAIRPRTLLQATGLPFLLVYGADDDKVATQSSWFSRNHGDVVAVAGDHLFESSAARAALLDAWMAFLTRVIPARHLEAKPR